MAGQVLNDTNVDFNNSSLIICSSEQGDNYSVDLQHESQISIAWKNLRFEATNWGFQKKVILKRLNGYFEIGSLNGLLGPSGAGKTTLLNCLSGTFKLGLSEDSEVYLNSKHQSTVSFFIEQHVHESIVGQLTVKQILQYAFAFKNGICHSGDVVEKYIRQTLKDLFLDEHVLDQHFESCSGGEQRRIAICQELMAIEKPSFLFVDEPTTGLDSASAAEVVKCLQKLSKSYQITVIASIHCPNSETLSFFDKLYILAKGGVCIFSGPPSMIQESLDQVQYETSSEQPPIEALVSIACNGTQDPAVTKLANQVLAEEHHSISLHQPSLTLQPNGLHVRQKGFSPIDFVLQCLRLSRITFIAKRKTLFISFSLLVVYFGIMASIFSPSMTTASACFSKDENSNMTSCTGNVQEDVKIRENICFLTFVILYTGMIIVCSSAILFSSFVKVFKSEHRNYWYSLGAFFWSSLLISFIEVSVYALFNACLGYFLPAQHAIDDYSINWSRFGLYFLFMWLLSVYMQSFGQLIGIILVNHMEFAIIACMIFNASLTLMNGLFVDMSRNENTLILSASNIVANKYISYGILYTFYGFQRCNWEKEYSIIIQFFEMDLNGVQHWITRVVVNVLIIKLFTLAVMYYKFGNFSGNLLFRLFKKCKDEHVLQSDLISIDYDELSVSIDGLNTNKKEANEKSSNEVQFDEFSRGRIMIAWRNLTLFGSSTIHEIGSSTMPRRPILRNLNGQFRFGTLNAIMGTSGAGKTSLLKVLNGRCKTRLGADTAFYLTQFTKIHTCFITQEVSNHLMPGLTAKQMLIFASRMKNTRTNVDHERVALKWLNELDLLNTMDTKVENCSGGERKRLAVALELTSIEMGPNLICLDECTSGLDSNSSRIVISTLHKLAQSHPLTIITSIHQPTAEVLYMFDQLYILARGGVCLYSGAPYDVKPYMNQLSGIIATDSKYAIETLIKHSCSNHHNPTVRKLVRHNDGQLLQVKTSELLDDTQLVLDGVQKNRHRFSLRSSFILFMRYFAYFRGHQWVESIFFAFNFFFYGFALRFFYEKKMIYITGCLNIQEDDTSACRRTPENVEELYQLLNNFKFNFFYANFFLFFIVFQCSMSFLKELKFFKNEHRNGWYSSGSLYLMKSLVDILPLIPVIMFYVYICNWYEEIRPGIYWNFVFVFLLGAIAFQGMGHVFAICSNGNITVLIVFSTTVFFFFTLLSNFLLTYSRLHYIYQFISNLAISKFIFEAVMLLIYGFERCKSNEIQQLLYTMTISDVDYNHCIIMLIFNIVFYRILTIYLLIWKANPVENRRQRMARIVDYMGNLEPARTLIPGLSASQLDLSVKVPNV